MGGSEMTGGRKGRDAERFVDGHLDRVWVFLLLFLLVLWLIFGCQRLLRQPADFTFQAVPPAYAADVERAWADARAAAATLDARAASLSRASWTIVLEPTVTNNGQEDSGSYNPATRTVALSQHAISYYLPKIPDYVYRIARHELAHAVMYDLWPAFPLEQHHGDPRFVAIAGGN